MAHLTGSQKKNRNKFIALLVAILVVAAAIFYVVYSAFMAKSAYLENQDFAAALSQVYDKAARSVSKEDLASSKLLVVNGTGNAEEFIVLTGGDEAVAEYAKWNEQSLASIEDPSVQVTANIAAFAKSAMFETESVSAADLVYFTGAEAIDLSGVEIADPAFISNFKNLKYGSFTACGLTDLSGFSALDLTKIESLNLSDNNITDWSVLEPIADKVIVSMGYTLVPDGESYSIAQVATTLAEQMASEAEAEAAENAEETAEDAVEGEEATEEVVEEATEEATEEETVDEAVEEVTEEVTEETTEETVEEETAEVIE